MNNNQIKQSYHHGNLRAELLTVAREILSQQGLEKVTIREIAREIGVSHTAPQRHFKNRQDLLDALALEGYVELTHILQESILRVTGDFHNRLRTVVHSFAKFAIENPALLQLMNASKQRDYSGSIKAASMAAFQPILKLIKEGQQLGNIGIGEPEEIGFILYATVLGITTMVNGGLVDRESMDGLIDKAINHYLKGYALG